MSRSVVDRFLSLLVTVPFLAAIAYLHFAHGVAFKLFILGSGSWGVGCILKLIVYHGVIRRLAHAPDRLLRTSFLNGLSSGICEIGVAILFFALLPALTVWEVVAFGVGIGAFEAYLVSTPSSLLKGTALEKSSNDLEETVARLTGARRYVYAYLIPIAERVACGFIHIGTRGLAYIALRAAILWPVLLALGAFVVADGLVGYRLHYQGRLSNLRTLNVVILILALIAVCVTAGFLASWRLAG